MKYITIEFIVIAVAYQKAPEHPFPIPFDDCYETLMWAKQNAAELGIDPDAIGVGGESAGANIAAGVAIKARDTGDIEKILLQLYTMFNGA